MTKEDIENFARLSAADKTVRVTTLKLEIEKASDDFLARHRGGVPTSTVELNQLTAMRADLKQMEHQVRITPEARAELAQATVRQARRRVF